jgi:hypothetical protein
MRRSLKSDIRLEVPGQFRICLTSDVISQRSGIARLSVCERQTGAGKTEGAGIAGQSQLERVPATTSVRPIMENRAEMPNGKRL